MTQTAPSNSRRVLITGADGQVGMALQKAAPPDTRLLALNRAALDITNGRAVHDVIQRFQPDWIVNAAAYTAVDKAESEPEHAFAINRDGVMHLARAAVSVNARVLHISTDYVFNGRQSHPYSPDDEPDPLSVYGESKLAGERIALEILQEKVCILRTSWVYAAQGRNFLTTMLRLMAERRELGVIEDQVGTPTSAIGLARVIYAALQASLSGIYHWSDAGAASWYDFAISIQKLAATKNQYLTRCRIRPIRTEDYPTTAQRPIYSLLDKSQTRFVLNISAEHWMDQLNETLINSDNIL